MQSSDQTTVDIQPAARQAVAQAKAANARRQAEAAAFINSRHLDGAGSLVSDGREQVEDGG